MLREAWAKAGVSRRISTNRRSYLKTKFGITEAQYAKMLAMGDGKCWVCGRPPKTKRLAVDHDHATGRVRALACWMCNKYRIGTNTVATAKKVLSLLDSDFDGRTA